MNLWIQIVRCSSYFKFKCVIFPILESLPSSFSSWFFLSSRIRHLFLSQAWAYRFVLFFWYFFATKETTNDETTNDETTNWHIVIFIFLCHFVISFVRCFLSLSIRHFSQTTNATRSSFVISSSTPQLHLASAKQVKLWLWATPKKIAASRRPACSVKANLQKQTMAFSVHKESLTIEAFDCCYTGRLLEWPRFTTLVCELTDTTMHCSR